MELETTQKLKLGDFIHGTTLPPDVESIQGVVIEITEQYITVEGVSNRWLCSAADEDIVIVPDTTIFFDKEEVNRVRKKYWKQWYGKTCPLL